MKYVACDSVHRNSELVVGIYNLFVSVKSDIYVLDPSSNCNCNGIYICGCLTEVKTGEAFSVSYVRTAI